MPEITCHYARALVRNAQGRYLIMRRGFEDEPVWTFPGGKIDPGEPPAEAVVRELYEETGIKLEARDAVHFTTVEVDVEDGRWRGHYFYIDDVVLAPRPQLGEGVRDDALIWATRRELAVYPTKVATLDHFAELAEKGRRHPNPDPSTYSKWVVRLCQQQRSFQAVYVWATSREDALKRVYVDGEGVAAGTPPEGLEHVYTTLPLWAHCVDERQQIPVGGLSDGYHPLLPELRAGWQDDCPPVDRAELYRLLHWQRQPHAPTEDS